MKQTMTAILVTLALLVGVPSWVAAQSPLEGVWELQDLENSDPNATTFDTGLIVFHGGHYSVNLNTSDRPTVANIADATADELRAAWGPVIAQAGTFELTGGDTLTLRPVAAMNPAVPGGFFEFRCALENDGDTLVLTPLRNSAGPTENPAVVRYRRVE